MIQQYPEPKGVLTQKQKSAYRYALQQLNATNPCSRCDAPVEELGMLPASAPLNLFKISEAVSGVQEMQLDLIVLSCLNCGAISMHSQKLLDNAVEKFMGETDEH